MIISERIRRNARRLKKANDKVKDRKPYVFYGASIIHTDKKDMELISLEIGQPIDDEIFGLLTKLAKNRIAGKEQEETYAKRKPIKEDNVPCQLRTKARLKDADTKPF